MSIERIIAAALGEVPFDLVIRGADVVNVFTDELYPADIGIIDGHIAHVTQPGELPLAGAEVFNARGKVAIPGLIDAHTHIESTMMTPAHFTEAVLPRGVTTIIADPHEICNVLGPKGLDYFLSSTEELPLRFMALVPSCVPAAVGFETVHANLSAKDIAPYLKHPRVAGLGEMMNFPGVLSRRESVMDILKAARESGKFIGGHCPTLTGRSLSAYAASGPESDHETRDVDEAIKKLRAGLSLECRYASNSHDLPVIADALKLLKYPPHAAICTDDREPDDVVHEGHLDAAVRAAIRVGVPPVVAVRMATHGAATLTHLNDRGAIKAGLLADIVLLDNLETLSVTEVFVGGKLAAQNGKLLAPLPKTLHLAEQLNTVKFVRELTESDFTLPKARLNGIVFRYDNPFVTKLDIFGLNDDYTVMAVAERHGVNGNVGLAPIRGLGLKYGAIAGTISHDCHNLCVFGTKGNSRDMLIAANTLKECGGGYVCVADGEVKALLPLPLFGLMSDKPALELAENVERLKDTVREMGIGAMSHSPLNFLAFFGLSVLPEARLTDMGLVDSLNQRFVPLVAED
ncbi:adenine deaminase [Clostridia bacterium]|nr:adenine deaminase [Clostridia bacterium]